MTEALYALGAGLHWTPTSAPRGEFVAIHDRVEASGAFLVHHFLTLFLKAGHRVCFLNFSQSIDHYTAVGRKLGVNLTASIDKEALRLIDCFSLANKTASTPLDLFQQIRKIATAAASASTPLSIVIDDITPLTWQWTHHQLVQFMRCCRALTLDTQGFANVVVLCHSDADPTGTLPSTTEILPMVPIASEIATVVLTVAPLPSGYFKDVHGTISVQRQCQGPSGLFEKSTMSFKVLENTVKTFATGGDALRSL